MSEIEFYKRLESHEPLKAKIVRDEFHSLALNFFANNGFERIKEDVWLHQVTDDIAHAIRIEALKGYTHHILLGVRLTFAPRVHRKWVRRHTPSEASWETLDLVHDPFAHIKRSSNDLYTNQIDCGSGLHYLRQDIANLLEDLVPRISSYFQSVDNLQSVLEKFELERTRKVYTLGFSNRGRHFISYPFLLARLGNFQAAEEMLTENLSRYMLDMDKTTRSKLFAKLQEIATIDS